LKWRLFGTQEIQDGVNDFLHGFDAAFAKLLWTLVKLATLATGTTRGSGKLEEREVAFWSADKCQDKRFKSKL